MAGVFNLNSQLLDPRQFQFGVANPAAQPTPALGALPDMSQMDLSSLGSYGTPAGGVPGVGNGGAGGGLFGINGLGANMDTFRLGITGLGTLGGLWNAYQAQGLAREQLDFTKRMANTNLNNQVTSYNTALEDRIRSRAAVEGQSSAEAEAYLDRNRLRR